MARFSSGATQDSYQWSCPAAEQQTIVDLAATKPLMFLYGHIA
jgi:hypothetical protein